MCSLFSTLSQSACGKRACGGLSIARPANSNSVEHRGHVWTAFRNFVLGEESDSVAVVNCLCGGAKSRREFVTDMDRLLVEFRICALRSVARRKNWQGSELQSMEVHLL